MSAVTAIRVDAESNTLLTAGRDKVVRAYDLDTLTPRSTTAVHETIEDCVILRASSAIVRDGKVKPPPNSAGVIFLRRRRFWTRSRGREGTAKHALESAPLVAEKTLTKGGDDEEDEFEAAASTFTKCALTHWRRNHRRQRRRRILTYVVNAETGAFEIENEIVANTDEIIGLSFVPNASEEAAMNVEGDDEDPDETRTLARIPLRDGVVTNSPTVRMFDPSTMSCVGSLSGHSAVVLCVDAALASDGTAPSSRAPRTTPCDCGTPPPLRAPPSVKATSAPSPRSRFHRSRPKACDLQYPVVPIACCAYGTSKVRARATTAR